jgi:hypothetical protein
MVFHRTVDMLSTWSIKIKQPRFATGKQDVPSNRLTSQSTITSSYSHRNSRGCHWDADRTSEYLNYKVCPYYRPSTTKHPRFSWRSKRDPHHSLTAIVAVAFTIEIDSLVVPGSRKSRPLRLSVTGVAVPSTIDSDLLRSPSRSMRETSPQLIYKRGHTIDHGYWSNRGFLLKGRYSWSIPAKSFQVGKPSQSRNSLLVATHLILQIIYSIRLKARHNGYMEDFVEPRYMCMVAERE